jgi:hypothetical protein
MTMERKKESLSRMEKVINWLLWHAPNFATGVTFATGVLAAATKYFAPIKGIVIVTMATIILDLILGVWAARKRGKGIKSVKLWRTVYKMLISFTVIHLLFSIDQEFGITAVHSYTVAGLFIIGFELWSILENAAVITDHKAFRVIRRYMEDKVKSSTGIDMDDERDKEVDDEQNSIK